jgi:uncharacterized protein YndB with AHSA1/START domain
MANDFTVSVDVAAAPHEVWNLAGDPARVHEWFTPVVDVRIKGDERTVTMANGATLVERLVDRDDPTLTYSYEVLSGIPGLTSHRATIWVTPHARGATINWRQQATSEREDYDIEARLSALMTVGLERLRDVLEGATGD